MIKKELELVINTGQAENALQGVDKAVNRIDKDLTKTEQEFGKVNKDAKQLDNNLKLAPQTTKKIVAEVKNVDKSLKTVDETVLQVDKDIQGTEKNFSKINTTTKQLENTIKKVPKSTKKITGGFRMMGTALKAAGIGLVLLAFATLKELFQQNQKVVDAFNIAFETLSLAFADFFNYISNNVGAVTSFFKSIFDDPLESLKTFATAIKDNLIERVKSAIEAFGFLALAMKKLFARDFEGALKAVKEAGKELVDVATGVDNSTEKISKTVKKGVEALTKYTKSTYDQAKSNVELKKQAELAAVANQGLIEKFDLLAETQRQIRDDERKSITERIAANNELGKILEQQQAAMLENAQLSLRSAKEEIKKDKDNIEFKKAVMEAENELAAVRAQIAGFRSEQQVNEASLNKEALEMTKSKLESETNLSIEQKRFNAEQIDEKLKSLEKQKEIDAEEREIQTTRLQGIVNDANAGTQAKIDAQIALNEFNQQADQQEVTRLAEIEAEKLRIKTEADAEKERLDKEAEEARKLRFEKEKQQAQEIQDLKFQLAQTTLSSIQTLTNAFAAQSEENAKKAFNVQKALAMVQVGINTAQAIMKAAAETTDFTPIQALRTGNMIAMGVAGAAQIAAIAMQKFNPSGGGTTPTTTPPTGGNTSPSQPPSFNIVGQSGFNQVAGALGSQPPIQAFVVAGAVTNAQQLQNNTINQATF